MIASICIISLLLQSVTSNLIPIHTYLLTPLFSISALIIIFPYFKDKNKYLFSCFIFGLCYDILFSSYLFINSFLFFLIGILILILNRQWNNHIFNIVLFQVLTVFTYQFIYYFLLSIIDKIEWNSAVAFKMVGNSLLLNVLYIIGLYYVTDFLSKKYKIEKSN
ncbi:MAG: hypothetical protein PHN72_02950 [Bacilli bacterium]|nr:hypothetical protein [Bacilli bacterium]